MMNADGIQTCSLCGTNKERIKELEAKLESLEFFMKDQKNSWWNSIKDLERRLRASEIECETMKKEKKEAEV